MPFGQAAADFWTIALSPLAIGSRADWATAAIEFTQVFFPPRTPSLNDVAAELIGGLLEGNLVGSSRSACC
jgi:VanZ family protein